MAYNDKKNYKQFDREVCPRANFQGKIYFYSVSEQGEVIKINQNTFEETKIKPLLKYGCATVSANNKKYTLKHLVASKFLKNYRKGNFVDVIDGNPFNCHIENLRVRKRGLQVQVNGVEYDSLLECAEALHCDYRTLSDYLNKKVKNSVLDGIEIQLVEGER